MVSERSAKAAGIWGWGVRGFELALAFGCLAASVVLKLTVDAHGPLWLDEAWTGAVVGTRGWGAFARQAWLDVNPPFYFLLMHLWTGVFGLSVASLRAPSVLAALATPLVVAFVRTPGLSGSERLAWASVLGLWAPGILFAQEARGYALLILISTLQTIAFIRLVRHATTARAAMWAASATAAVLTHYHAGFLIAAQAACLLAVYRRGVLRLWPAALVFLPALGWMAIHASRVAVFARPDVAWYPPLAPHVLEEALEAFVGGWPLLAGMGAIVVGGAVVERALDRRGVAFSPGEGALWLAILSALAAAGAVLALGWLRPSFTPRYLVVFGPSALLGLVIAARNLSDSGARLARIALLGMAAGAAAHLASTQNPVARRAYQFQTASEALMRAGVTQVAFLWDNPTDRALAPEERAALAGFFFRRAGHPVQIIAERPAPGEDPNPALVRAAQAPGAGLMWLYDLRVPGAEARHSPPRLEALDPALRCRRYVGGAFEITSAIGVIACVRAPASLPPVGPPR